MRCVIRRAACAAVLVLLPLPFARPASAQVVETRQDDANPMVSVFKSTVYGAAAGTLLGLAVAVADKGNDNADAVRWGFVSGTFFGFAYGIYHVSTRPRAGALIEGGAGQWGLAPPELQLGRGRADVSLIAYRF